MTMTRRRSRLATALVAVALGSLFIGGSTLARSDLSSVRAATARFHSLNQAARGGYGPFPAGVPLHECIASFDNSGAMGIHYVNGGLLDNTLDANHPEVLVYAPDAGGKLHLAALEYVIFQDAWREDHPDPNDMPMVLGQEMMPVGFPNRYEIPAFFALHVWLWQSNPSGLYAPFNPNVSCAGATASAGAAGTTTAAAASPVGQLAMARDARFICSMGRTI
jgi:hypothetical protein